MRRLSATLRLRPIRIALLVRPTDFPSVRQFMRICTCMWGGVFNPIIPVYRSRPPEWRRDPLDRMSGAQVTQGYVDFFEPDAFVEAEPCLLEKGGLDRLRNPRRPGERVFPLQELLACQDHRDWSELTAGLEILDVLKHIHEIERRFTLRDPRPAILAGSLPGNALVEAMFGVYPAREESRHFGRGYRDVFRPHRVSATADTWREVYLRRAITPLAVTRHALEHPGVRRDDLVIYVFDGTSVTDLIDLWNLRLEPMPLLPIPIQWWPDLVGDVATAIQRQYRPLPGNPHGVMQRTTIEISRSISDEERDHVLSLLNPQLPSHSWACKAWRTRIWSMPGRLQDGTTRPLRITAKEKHITLSVGNDNSADFDGLVPDFASIYGGGQRGRWVNVVEPMSSSDQRVATVIPFNVADQSWPRLHRFGPVVVSSEGWSFTQRLKGLTTTIQLQTHEQTVIDSLSQRGVKAHLSDAGQIAKQVLHHLGGTWGIRLLADVDTLKLLNRMAGGFRRRGDGNGEGEEAFERRSSPKKQWYQLISERGKRRRYEEFDIPHFTKRNMIRLGLITSCPQCTASNWHSLKDSDYVVTCSRCLETYPFPQGALKGSNANWGYRVVGPFASPDYARGAYGALLSLNVILNTSLWQDATVTTALSLDWEGGEPCEVDYVAWIGKRSFLEVHPPELVVGEAKSFARKNLIEPNDLAKLRSVGKKLPGAAIVISVMREEFNAREKDRLRAFAKWARRRDENGNATNPLILLTGVELFRELDLMSTWNGQGGPHAELATYENTHDLRKLAEATQALYLS